MQIMEKYYDNVLVKFLKKGNSKDNFLNLEESSLLRNYVFRCAFELFVIFYESEESIDFKSLCIASVLLAFKIVTEYDWNNGYMYFSELRQMDPSINYGLVKKIELELLKKVDYTIKLKSIHRIYKSSSDGEVDDFSGPIPNHLLCPKIENLSWKIKEDRNRDLLYNEVCYPLSYYRINPINFYI